ncbi:MAG: TrmH family RNA methyltransferase [Pseudomonadota bacterium]|nr:TrmH family RNA methyltransferase [Pseudomonadota bacterium]
MALRERVIFVLVRPLQSGNVGAAARAMKNMGLRRLAVVAPPAFDVDRARWMAPGAAEILDQAHYVSSVAEAVAGCHYVVATTARGRHDRWPAHTPATFAARVFGDLGPGAGGAPVGHETAHTAVLFGPEDRGLDNDELLHAHALLHIPTDVHASLNLSQAALLVGAALFAEAQQRGYVPRADGEGRRGGPARGAPPGATQARPVVNAGELDPLVNEWMTTLELGTYFRGHEPVLVMNTLRRILERAGLEPGEVMVLRGMLRKMRWKMNHP